MRHRDIGHLERHRHQIIGHRRVLKLAVLGIDAFLVEGAADALHHPAPDLFVDQLRVDHPAAILDRPEIENLHEAGFRSTSTSAAIAALVNTKGKSVTR